MEPLKKIAELYGQDTKDDFLDALIVLMSRKKYSEITVKELCQQANYSRKTFYDNFREKDDVLTHLAENIAMSFRLTDDHTNHLHFFRFWYELRDLAAQLIENDLLSKVCTLSFEIYVSLLRERNWDSIYGRFADNREYAFEFVAAGCYRMVYLWYCDGFQQTPEELAGLVDHILCSWKS